jgi:lipoprotein-releasing system permease protein
MLFNKKGSLIGAVLAVTIGILVIHVNFVIFQGLFDAIVRDISNYRNGDILVTDEADYIDKSDLALVNWFERIPFVQGATPRLSSSAEINMTKNGNLIEETRVPVVGVDPLRDVKASTAHETVADGTYVLNRNSVVLGNNVATDLGNAQVGDSLKMLIVDRTGEDQIRRFTVAGIVKSPGGQGLDYSVVMHIDTLRDMMGRSGESGSFMVKLNDPTKALEVKEFFLAAYPNDDFIAETIEESAEEQLAGFRSGIAMINLIGYFGMMSSAFAIVTIQMMLVNGKTREIGVMRSAIGAGVGTAAGLGYTIYAKETKMSFMNSIPLEVNYNWEKIIQTALLSFSLAIIASLYPSYRATKLLPVEAMRTV